MGLSIRIRTLATLGVLATLGAGAQASTSVHITVGVPSAAVVHVPPPPHHPPHVGAVHAPAYPVYDAPAVHRPGPRYGRHAGWAADHCRAPRWDPHVRYMPGQVVRRQGALFVAKPISARVWNENSPPEWTPRYWAAAECR